MTILILGSTGLIGKELQSFFNKKNIQYLSDTRNSKLVNNNTVYYDLNDFLSFKINDKKIKTIIYLSHIKYLTDKNINIQLDALRYVVNISKKNNIKLIFISSQSAYKNLLSRYANLKFKQSLIAIENNALSISVGLFISHQSKGFFNLIKKVSYFRNIKFKITPDIPLETFTINLLGFAIIKAIETNLVGNYFLYNYNQLRSYNNLVDKFNPKSNMISIYIPTVIFKFLIFFPKKIFYNSVFIESIWCFLFLQKFKSNKKIKSLNNLL
jgi:hypothetical protein